MFPPFQDIFLRFWKYLLSVQKYTYTNLQLKKMATATVSIEDKSTKNENNVEMEKQLKERAEKNRQRAILLKKSKVVNHPYARWVFCNVYRRILAW